MPDCICGVFQIHRKKIVMLRVLFIVGATLLCVAMLASRPVTAQNKTEAKKRAAVIPVRIVRTKAGWQMLRGGKPYFIKGAGGDKNLPLLVKAGGNSIRTWAADDLEPLLDRAHAQGLSVTVGIWLGHEAHRFRYDDPAQVRAQWERAREQVRRYRNHPAVLMWGLGNEMEGPGTNPLIWKAVEDIARMVRQEDPNHPTSTVVAEAPEAKIAGLKKYCPSVNVLGVNAYGGLRSLPDRLAKLGWDRPYFVSEFGPLGPWEVGKTEWGASIEPSSTDKATFYAEGYQQGVAAARDRCLGSYVFLWGDKVETTHTWFGMFLPGTGERLGTVDVMTQAWSGRAPANRAPQIVRSESGAALKTVAPGSAQTALCVARDPDGDRLTYAWEVRPEKPGASSVEPGQKAPDPVSGSVGEIGKNGDVSFTAPQTPGPYRLFVYVRDGKGGAATANLPFRVKE